MNTSKPGRTLALLGAACVLTLAIDVRPGIARDGAVSRPLASPGQQSQLGQLPFSFEPNRGQAPANVRYLAHGAGYTVALTDSGALLQLSQSTTGLRRPGMERVVRPGTVRQVTLRLLPGGANRHPRLTARQKLPGIVNYFIGNDPNRWHTDISTYAQVTYHSVYPGVDLVFYGSGGQLEYDWRIHAHANPAVIVMVVGGAQSTTLDRSGNLLLGTALGAIRQRAPSVYQMRNGQRIAVSGGYRLSGGSLVSFRLAAYDHSRPLTIDPALAYGTYLGDSTVANGVAVDSAGNTYLTGRATGSVPTSSSYQSQSAGSPDAFVSKLNASGSALVYSTYLGGASSDIGNAIAVDGSGSAYITGQTYSSDFPGLPGVATAAASAAFVVKLSPAGNTIAYAHGYPNGYSVSGTGIAVDRAGDAFYTADLGTASTSAVKSYAAVNELATDGSLIHSLGASGGSGSTNASGVALDGQGNVYVAGSTNAPDFFVSHALQLKLGSGYDAFLIKLDAGFNRLYSTFLGGGSSCPITAPYCGADDYANAVAVDARGNVYVAGSTASADFPTASPLQGALAGKQDGFVTELNPAGTAFVYSTYLGGHETGVESLNAIAVDGAGNAYVTGETTAADYPTVDPLPGSGFKGNDAMVTEIAAGGQSLIYSTYLSGAGASVGAAIAVDAAGNAYVAGLTTAADFPISPSAIQQSESGRYSAFAVKLAPPPPGSTSTPTPTATATRTATPTPNATLLYTPAPTTATPMATATRTPTPTPGLTVITTPTPPAATATPPVTSPTAAPSPGITVTPTRVSSRRRPPATPRIVLRPLTLTSGDNITIRVTTSTLPLFPTKVILTIQAKRGRTLLFRIVTAARQVNTSGRRSWSIRINYNPATQVRVLVAAQAKNTAGSTVDSAYFTLVHDA